MSPAPKPGSDAWILRLYGGRAWPEIIARSWPGRVFHGQELVMAEGYLGCGDNVDRARRTLRAAEALGLVIRRTYRPSREQQFFGTNGQFGREVMDPVRTGHSEICYEWELLEKAFVDGPLSETGKDPGYWGP